MRTVGDVKAIKEVVDSLRRLRDSKVITAEEFDRVVDILYRDEV